VRDWLVAGGLIERDDGQLLLVQNRRRDGSLDWTPPGGVIEAHEEAILEGLTREVEEETGITVLDWAGPLWRVEATAPAMGWTLRAEVHQALSWKGELRVGDDPDGIVVDAGFVALDECGRRLTGSAPWVCEPVTAWLGGTVEPLWRYHLEGRRPGPVVVTRL
jgi:8-oxo-dGTP diphosphatase